MEQSLITIGMRVKIKSIYDTDIKYSSCHDMHRMIGKTYKIKNIKKAGSSHVTLRPGELMFVVDNDGGREFVWSAKDLERADPIPNMPKKATFNPENIVR